MFCRCWNHLQPKAIWEKLIKIKQVYEIYCYTSVNGLFAVDKPNKETKLTNCYNKRYKKKY